MVRRGETCRGIEAVLRAEGIAISFATVSRIASRLNATSTAPPPPPPARAVVPPRPAPPPSAAPPEEVAAEGDPAADPAADIEISEDPRELQKGHWLYYERLVVLLRRRAERELGRDNLRGYQALLGEARKAEERAAELRPPAPPDPEKDPTYCKAAQALTSYLEALVSAAEGGKPLPPRELPATEAA